MSKKKIIVILVLLLLIGAAAWYFYLKGSGSIGKSNLYQRMVGLADSKIKDGTPAWLLQAASDKLDSGDVDPYYFIGGKITDASAFLAAYDAGYYGYGYDYVDGKGKKDSGAEYDLHETLHKWLQAEQKKALKS